MYAPDEQGNFLRYLMQQGLAQPNEENALLAMLQQPDFVAQPAPLADAVKSGRNAGFSDAEMRPPQPQFAPVQHTPPVGMDSARSGSLGGDDELNKFRATAAQQGVLTNADLEAFLQTGRAPQRQAPLPRGQRMQVAGYGGGQVSDLGYVDEAPPMMDVSRPGLEIAGVGKGQYGKDGNLYVPDGRGGMKKVILGYDRAASQQAAKNDLERRKGEAGIRLTEEQIASSKATRTTKENKPTAGQTAADKEFAKEYVSYRAAGGFADTQKQLAQLEDVHKQLGTGKNLTGAIVGNAPDWILAIQNPAALAARDAVQEVVQRNLRVVLGAQFTEREGERLIARAYNPRLDEAENKKRLGRLIMQIKNAAQAKQEASDYFEANNGSLAGWKGKMPSWSDFDPDSDAPGQQNGGTQFDSLPNPAQFAGKRMQGPDGIYKSDGSRWIKQ